MQGGLETTRKTVKLIKQLKEVGNHHFQGRNGVGKKNAE